MRSQVLCCPIVVALLLFLAAGPPARGDTIAFSAGSGNLSAKAIFTIAGGNLVVTLVNTSNVDVTQQADLLTAVFWDDVNNPTLSVTGGSAFLASGSNAYYGNGTVFNWTQANLAGIPTGDVGTEYAFKHSAGGLPGVSQHYGLSSAGLGIVSPSDRFETTYPDGLLSPPADPDGSNFGISSAGDVLATPINTPQNKPFIKNGIVMTLTGNATTVAGISNVRFQYGTGLSEPHITSIVPIPASVWSSLAMLGLLGIGSLRRKG